MQNRVEMVEDSVANMEVGGVKTINLGQWDIPIHVYRVYLSQYAGMSGILFKTTYDRYTKILTVRRVE
jgi:hypothetical protein